MRAPRGVMTPSQIGTGSCTGGGVQTPSSQRRRISRTVSRSSAKRRAGSAPKAANSGTR